MVAFRPWVVFLSPGGMGVTPLLLCNHCCLLLSFGDLPSHVCNGKIKNLPVVNFAIV